MGLRGLRTGVLGVLCAVFGVLGFSGAVAWGDSCPNAALRTGPSGGLPDCRAFEQVSPLDKGGFAAYPASGPLAQVAPDGEGVAYLGYQAFPGAAGNSALFAGHVSRRTAGDWQTTDVTPGVPSASVLRIYLVGYAFSEDLSQVVLKVPMVPLTAQATPGVFNLYLRHPDGSYSSVNSALPKVSAEEQCGPALVSLCFLFADVSAFAGASSDFSHVLFESTAQFVEPAPETGIESLYESSGGQVRLVGVLPDGNPAATSTAGAGSSAAYYAEPEVDRRVERAMSSDGSRVVFQAPADGGAPDEAQSGLTEVYDRIGGRETVELSAPAPGATPAVATAEPATFWAASKDGSQVFFTSAAELTSASNTGAANNGEDLYEYDFSKPPAERLRDLTVDSADANGAEVQGVVDASADGAYVYFVAKGQLVAGKGVLGQPNLYMVHDGGSPVFVTTLSGSGECVFQKTQSSDSCDWTSYPVQLEAYVTPDGRHLGFMSTMSISTMNFPAGYDNIDQQTGEADSEVYEYNAPSAVEEGHGESGRLVCASCDPSGARPTGSALIGGITRTQEHFDPEHPAPYAGVSSPFARLQSVSDDGGRVFYSAPALSGSPAPRPGVYDRVYEYEQAGQGSCAAGGGCQFMISSPGGTLADQFLGASASGGDVFFATSSRLVGGDQDSLPDVYDARVGGGFQESSEPVCESGCRMLVAPSGDAAPGSESAGPSGNLSATQLSAAAPAPKKRAKPKCAKGRGLRHGRCVKVKVKKRAKRANGNRRAR